MSARARSKPAGRVVRTTPPAGWRWLLPPTSAQERSGWALLPLRAFLGFTFCFAGLQKLANPGFFDAANPASIQAQMAGAERRSPIHALLTPLSHHAVAIGVIMALGELAVGVGALFGFLTRIAALGGVVISLNLFLAVSYHTSPYYTGSDIVFAFAWLPLLIAGGGLFSLDALVANLAAARRERMPGRAPALDTDRRRLVGVLALGVGGIAVLGAGAAAGFGRLLHTSKPRRAAIPPLTTSPPTTDPTATPTGTATTTGTPTPTATATPTPTAAGPSGTKIGAASAVPVKGAASFQDPATGDPAIVVQPTAGTFLAFDAICPHAGCTVQYDGGSAAFVCPCHGSRFDGKSGAVTVGPASNGLAQIRVAKGQDGQLYVD
ncbi:MAG: thiosulfate dehydrogenase (quinone) large subunit [Actinomycetota bacterium]|nr:thiosulfate dehydrogenase (quinone) large subunit [Actinomycetota bacterium]